VKLCIAGKNDIAVDCLYYSLSFIDRKSICVVLNKDDPMKNTWQKSLGFYAKKENIEILTLEKVQKIKDITFLSLEFDQIINTESFQTRKIYNIHFSLLPEYKGMYTSILPIIHGKDYSGVTLHEIDNGIDTGDIIEQKRFSISGIVGKELYIRYIAVGTLLISKNMTRLLNKEYTPLIQSSVNSTYYSKTSFRFNEIEIKPRQTAFQIQQFVNAINFRPYQLPVFRNNEIFRTQIKNIKSDKKAGTILIEDNEKIEISTMDFNIILFKDYYNELMDCCISNNLDRAEQVIDYITNLDEIDKNGWNFLMVACYNNSYDLVKLLIEKDADVNTHNLNGTTIIMYAKDAYIKSNDLSIINLILDKGANVNALDIHGKTIFDYCKDQNLQTILKLYK
jgi:methionyl-tRNA formyltransferase